MARDKMRDKLIQSCKRIIARTSALLVTLESQNEATRDDPCDPLYQFAATASAQYTACEQECEVLGDVVTAAWTAWFNCVQQ